MPDPAAPIESNRTKEPRAASPTRQGTPWWSRLQGLVPARHYMAFAPLDVWFRLLAARGAPPEPAYLPRICANLFVSTIATVATLPERVFIAVLRASADKERLSHEPGTLCVLGYYRSGTTHLHYLLSCDRRFVTPRWHQVLQPHGFVVTWTLLKWALLPFIPNERPQDDVAFGADWPAEDDFAVANLELASPLIGRFVYPSRHDVFKRYQNLEGLTDRELARWRRAQALTLWKITRPLLSRWKRKRLLLKSPCHTGRVSELRRMLHDNVTFVHISRDPEDVVRSNVAMDGRLTGFLLERGADRETIRRRVLAEYERTETKCIEESADLPPDRIVRIRYTDLVADPVGQLQLIYQQLGIEWSPDFERRVKAYLGSVGSYTPAAKRAGVKHAPLEPEQAKTLARLRERLEIERPPADAVPPPKGGVAIRLVPACVAAAAAMVISGVAWLGWSWLTGSRSDWLVWPIGALIGLVGVRTAGAGSALLGAWCVVLMLLVLASVQLPLTLIIYDHGAGMEFRDWLRHNLKGSIAGLTSTTTLVYALFGGLSAFRCATRKHARPPGA